MKDTFGQKIKKIISEKELTQEYVADNLGVSAQAVSKWENDISYPDIMILPSLAKLFDVTVDYLINDGEYNELLSIKEENKKLKEEVEILKKNLNVAHKSLDLEIFKKQIETSYEGISNKEPIIKKYNETILDIFYRVALKLDTPVEKVWFNSYFSIDDNGTTFHLKENTINQLRILFLEQDLIEEVIRKSGEVEFKLSKFGTKTLKEINKEKIKESLIK
ncbi:MAG: helix-turn-helix domain-containing protein [Acholeplasmatales bacterium]